jgi:hypothetical protein
MTTNPPSPQGDHSGALPLETLELIEDALIAVLRGRPPKECRPALARAFTSMCRSLEAWGVSEWEAYLHGREVVKRGEHELLLIWDALVQCPGDQREPATCAEGGGSRRFGPP